MTSYGEALVQGMYGSSSAILNNLKAGQAINKMKEDREIRNVRKEAQNAYDTERKRILGDTNMTDYDRTQALNAAQGDFFDKVGAKYSEYGRDEDFNKMVNAWGNRRKEERAALEDYQQRNAAAAHDKAYDVTQRRGLVSLVQLAQKGDAASVERMKDIAEFAGVQFKSENGQFLWAPKGAENAQFVPMDMERALEAYNAFTSFEDKIRHQLEKKALLDSDTAKLDAHTEAKDKHRNSAIDANYKQALTQKITSDIADKLIHEENGGTYWQKSNGERYGYKDASGRYRQGGISMEAHGDKMDGLLKQAKEMGVPSGAIKDYGFSEQHGQYGIWLEGPDGKSHFTTLEALAAQSKNDAGSASDKESKSAKAIKPKAEYTYEHDANAPGRRAARAIGTAFTRGHAAEVEAVKQELKLGNVGTVKTGKSNSKDNKKDK